MASTETYVNMEPLNSFGKDGTHWNFLGVFNSNKGRNWVNFKMLILLFCIITKIKINGRVFLSFVIIPFQFLSKPNRQITIHLTDYISFLSTKHLVKPDNIPFQFLPEFHSFDRFHSFRNHSANQTSPKPSTL